MAIHDSLSTMFDSKLAACGEKECDYATPDAVRDYWLARCREVLVEAIKAEIALKQELRRRERIT